jgi:Zn-dependent protease with chaperone function
MKMLQIVLGMLLFLPVGLAAQAEPGSRPEMDPAQTKQQPAYSLQGDKLEKAIRVSRIRETVHFVDAGWSIVALVMLLALGVPARLRNVAENVSGNRWLQCAIFLPLFFLLMGVVDLPIGIYMQYVERAYGLSVQSWGGWIWDAVKSFLIAVVLLYLPAMFLQFVLRKSPKNWWLFFWLLSLPCIVFLVFIAPVVLDPLMNHFYPLEPAQPALVQRLETIVARGGLEIPPSRMFLMKASEKTTQLNAYVTGVGASKRVVVWDTSIQKATPDQISFIFGHEMGHYVLNHLWKGMAFTAVILLVTFYLAKVFVDWALRRFGTTWHLRGLSDWGSFAVLALALSIFGFLLEPVTNGFSRHIEHEADVYGLEAIHGIVADPQEAARSSFQVLGEASLVDPQPNAFVEFWTGSHPSIASRAAFAASYDPWREGQQPKFFKK